MNKWYKSSGNNSDVVMYSRIRLARNIADTCFPHRMSKELVKSLNKRLWAIIKNSEFANEFDMIQMSDLSNAAAESYAEKQLISRTMIKDRKNSSFLLSKNENVSIMLCEEDHIRIRSFAPGQDLEAAYNVANEIDDTFISSLNIAFSDKLGFLTSSPVNLGTGLKATFVLHLPALSQSNSIYKLSSMVGKLGLSLREVYKDGAGDIYALSNQVSLGITEKSAIDNLNAVCDQIVKQERAARENLKNNFDFEDKAFRTLGVLRMARVLDAKEMLSSLSVVRLGISLGYFDIDYSVIGDMLYELQDASLLVSSKTDLSKSTLAKLRAQLVREKLN